MRRAIFLVMLLSLSLHGAPRRYSGRGLVLAVDLNARTITVSHDQIAGFMEPMVMTLKVADPKLLNGLARGARIYFRLAVERDRSILDHVLRVSADPVDPAKWQEPVVSRVTPIGEPVPDFRLTDQAGNPVSLSQFRGKVVVVTFIYTRCPLPDYCPRMTANFSALRQRFTLFMGKDLVLLSVTFDPEHDTPQVLLEYARARGANIQGWHFLTGTKQEITRVAGLFGLEYWPDQGLFTHNLQTALVDRGGRLAATVEGKDYTAAQLGDLVERLLQEP